eukprot:747721-Hanusia_phi.AAC.4
MRRGGTRRGLTDSGRCVYDYRNHVNDCLLCSGNGICNENATCICDVGWKGEDCREASAIAMKALEGRYWQAQGGEEEDEERGKKG